MSNRESKTLSMAKCDALVLRLREKDYSDDKVLLIEDFIAYYLHMRGVGVYLDSRDRHGEMRDCLGGLKLQPVRSNFISQFITLCHSEF